MNSKQRVMAALQGSLPDRVPAFIMSRHYSMRLANLSFKSCLEDISGEKYAKAQAEAYRLYGYDGVMDLEGVNAESEAFGSVLAISEDVSPSVIVPRIQDIEEIEHLEIPDIKKSQTIIRQLNVVKNLRKYIGTEVPIYANVQCPFRSAAMLRGMDNFLRDLYKNPKKVHKLLEKTTQMAFLYGKELVENGSDVLMPSNPMASGDVISREHYREFVFPYDKEMVDSFRKVGICSILHICGDVSDRLDLIADTGYDGASLDSMVDLAYAKREVGARICLIGNVDVFNPLREGTPAEVVKKAEECIERAGAGGGFMLSAGCEVVADTPEENLIALIETSKRSFYIDNHEGKSNGKGVVIGPTKSIPG